MWYAKINYIDPVTKKSTQKVKRGFATQREAKQYEIDFRAEIQKNGFNPLINPKASFLDVYAAYQRHVECKELRADTIETKENMIYHYILPYFEKYTIGEIDENVLKKCKLLYINYPNNPTGAVANRQFFKEVINRLSLRKSVLKFSIPINLGIETILKEVKLSRRESITGNTVYMRNITIKGATIK